MELIEKALNVRSLYHRLIAGNIANSETPNYKERYIDFKEALRIAERGGEMKVRERVQGERPDGNTVDMERQVSELTQNSLHFYALLSSLTKKFSLIRYVINEGRR